jgi:hypothetical protein
MGRAEPGRLSDVPLGFLVFFLTPPRLYSYTVELGAFPTESIAMLDLLFIGLSLFFWILIGGILVACDNLMEKKP